MSAPTGAGSSLHVRRLSLYRLWAHSGSVWSVLCVCATSACSGCSVGRSVSGRRCGCGEDRYLCGRLRDDHLVAPDAIHHTSRCPKVPLRIPSRICAAMRDRRTRYHCLPGALSWQMPQLEAADDRGPVSSHAYLCWVFSDIGAPVWELCGVHRNASNSNSTMCIAVVPRTPIDRSSVLDPVADGSRARNLRTPRDAWLRGGRRCRGCSRFSEWFALDAFVASPR